MKAIVITEYGSADVLQLKEIEQPKPKDTELLIKNYATAVSSGDWKLRKAEPFIIRLFLVFCGQKKQCLAMSCLGKLKKLGRR